MKRLYVIQGLFLRRESHLENLRVIQHRFFGRESHLKDTSATQRLYFERELHGRLPFINPSDDQIRRTKKPHY